MSASQLTKRTPVCILGAGVTGLSAAYHLSSKYRLLEAAAAVGGVASSFAIGRYRFDRAIHVLYTRDPYASTLLKKLLGNDLVKHIRNAAVYSARTFTRYPYQAHQKGLPPEIIEENILGLIERSDSAPTDFHSWIHATYGEGIARNFMVPYNQKVWATDLRQMTVGWIADRVPNVDVRDVLRSVLYEDTTEYGPNAEFWYPRRGGMQRLPDSFVKSGVVPECNSKITSIDPDRHVLSIEGRHDAPYDSLISTLPLPTLIGLLSPRPGRLMHLAKSLVYNRVLTLNIGLRSDRTNSMYWVYVPDPSIPFQRYSVPSNFSDDAAPEGHSAIITEASFKASTVIDVDQTVRETISALERIGAINSDDVEVVSPRIIDPAYVVPTLGSAELVEELLEGLRALGIESCGRFGAWEYLNMDESILQGKAAAERVLHVMDHA